MKPSVLSWREMYDLTFLSQSASGKEMAPVIEAAIDTLEKRKRDGYVYGSAGAPRVLVTGCPIAGDAQKVFSIIEGAGGVIVTLDSCTGFKNFVADIEEGTGNPVRVLAEHYLTIPCSCMTPNTRRLTELTRMIDTFKPDAVVDIVLQACHSYNIESHKVGEHAEKKQGLPFLKIVTDFSQSDVGQIRTRVEALVASYTFTNVTAPDPHARGSVAGEYLNYESCLFR